MDSWCRPPSFSLPQKTIGNLSADLLVRLIQYLLPFPSMKKKIQASRAINSSPSPPPNSLDHERSERPHPSTLSPLLSSLLFHPPPSPSQPHGRKPSPKATDPAAHHRHVPDTRHRHRHRGPVVGTFPPKATDPAANHSSCTGCPALERRFRCGRTRNISPSSSAYIKVASIPLSFFLFLSLSITGTM